MAKSKPIKNGAPLPAKGQQGGPPKREMTPVVKGAFLQKTQRLKSK